ncbi:MAG TPA: hypothetical protein VFO54_10415 [Chryseosolibacter sp.]|nr:hypothetical protein [Chryseosolibacter sp.]
MKKAIITIVCGCALLVSTSAAIANDYIGAMQKSIEAVYQASDIRQLQEAVNTLERIGAAEPSKWEPQYYAAFGYIMMATRENDAAAKDTYLDRAMTATEKARSLAPGESEIIAIEGFIYMMKVTVDPASRGPEYAPRAQETFGKAIALNTDNPRPLALMAQMQYGTARFLGNSISDACSLVDKSLEKFEAYKSENPLAPTWGKPMALALKQQCK